MMSIICSQSITERKGGLRRNEETLDTTADSCVCSDACRV